jgi:hypothetical protein
LGTFLADPTDVPRVVVDYLARQLNIADLSVLKGYGDSETRWDHAAEIRRAYGYRDFGDDEVHGRLREWLDARAWTMGERPGVLFDLAVALAARAQSPPAGPDRARALRRLGPRPGRRPPVVHLGLGGADLAGVAQGRLEALARFTAKARAPAI